MYYHYNDVIMSTMAPQITSVTIVYSTIYARRRSKKHQSPASLAFVRGIHRWPVISPHKGPVTRKMFPFDDVIMTHKRVTLLSICSWARVLTTHFKPYQFMELEWGIYESVTEPKLVQITTCRLLRHYLSLSWDIVYWTLRNSFQGNLQWNTTHFINKIRFENAIC